jgi:hypothetical protein
LARHGAGSDDVLWAALFVLAVLIRDSSAVFGPAAAAVARAGGLEVGLKSLLQRAAFGAAV